MLRMRSTALRWWMLAGLWLIYVCFGLVMASLAPLVTAVATDLNVGLATMGFIFSAWLIAYIPFAIPAGWIVDRWGVERALLLACVLIALSAAGRALATNDWQLFLAVALFGVGGPLVSSGAPKLVGQWFESSERGLAVGIYISAPIFGGALALALTHSVLLPWLDNQWRAVLWFYCVVTLLTAVLWFLLYRLPMVRTAQAKKIVHPPATPAIYIQLLRDVQVRRILWLGAGILFLNHGLNNWLPQILILRGMTDVAAGYWSAAPTVVGLIGALLVPYYTPAKKRLAVLIIALLASAGGTLFLFADVSIWLYAGLVLQGVAKSALMPLTILLLIEYPGVGIRYAGAASGLYFTFGQIGGAAGPSAIGSLAEWTHAFSWPLWVMVVVTLLLMHVAWQFNRYAAQKTALESLSQ
ncbi:MAG: MFS transporter [Gammaproteobacteria bacterium]|nr:MFS transporter [Gammaproteobacteria bacterium]